MDQKEPSTIGPSSTLQTRKNTHTTKKERFEINNQEEPSQQTNIKKMQTEQSKKNHSETNFKTKLKGPRLLPQNWAHFDLFRTPLGDSNHPLPRCLR